MKMSKKKNSKKNIKYKNMNQTVGEKEEALSDEMKGKENSVQSEDKQDETNDNNSFQSEVKQAENESNDYDEVKKKLSLKGLIKKFFGLTVKNEMFFVLLEQNSISEIK